MFIEVTVQAVDDDLGFLHASLALQSACQESGGWLDDSVAVAQECLHVVLGGRMSVHVEIHGWSDEDRGLHRQIGSDEHVVGDAVCHLSHCGSRTGRNEHGVSPEAEVDMRVPCTVSLREELADNGFVGKGRERDGSDELLAGRCDDNLHFGSPLDEASYDEARFVGCYRASDAQYYFLSFKTHFSDLNI